MCLAVFGIESIELIRLIVLCQFSVSCSSGHFVTASGACSSVSTGWCVLLLAIRRLSQHSCYCQAITLLTTPLECTTTVPQPTWWECRLVLLALQDMWRMANVRPVTGHTLMATVSTASHRVWRRDMAWLTMCARLVQQEHTPTITFVKRFP